MPISYRYLFLKGIPLAVQWLGLHASTAGGPGSIPGHGTKILQAPQRGQKKKKKDIQYKQYCKAPSTVTETVFNK